MSKLTVTRGFRAFTRASAFAGLAVACTRSLPHEFDPRVAHEYFGPAMQSGTKAEAAERAVLLIPAHASVHLPQYGGTWSWNDRDITVASENYVGPARVFLASGKRTYVLEVETTEGSVEFELRLDLEAGQRYEIAIVEDSEQVSFELYKLHPRSYATLYPHDESWPRRAKGAE